MRYARGLTLLELLIAISLAAVLAAAGAPLFRAALLEARMAAAVNALVHTAHLARNAAQVDVRDVVVCRSIDALQCAQPGNWSSGWIAFVNRDHDDPPAVDDDERILQASGGQPLQTIRSNRRAYVLRPSPRRATNGTVVFCDARGAAEARAVIISYSGRPRVARRSATGQPLSCPA